MKALIDFNIDYTLEDEFVLLRPLQNSDYDNLLPFSLEQPDLWKYSMISAAGTDGLKRYLSIATENRVAGKEYPFVVFDKTTGQYAGSTRFYDIQPDWQTTQLGYTWYGKQFQGTGLNKHCKFLLLSHAFDVWNMERVEFRADNRNEKSIAAMKSIGCIVEGVLRSHTPLETGGRRDSIVLSILKSEWENGVKQALQKKLKH